MYRNDAVAVDPSLIDALNEATTASPEEMLIEAEDFAEAEGVSRDEAFATIN